jgi:hypothetical protein
MAVCRTVSSPGPFCLVGDVLYVPNFSQLNADMIRFHSMASGHFVRRFALC